MADTAIAQPILGTSSSTPLGRGATLTIPPPALAAVPLSTPASRLRSEIAMEPSFSPVNQNGSFEFDRVIKAGYVQKRTQKTKARTWKPAYLVLRPNTLYIYKSDKESKLRHKIYLSDLSAVTLLKDPKQKRQNLFGLFTPSKNFHLEASSAKEARDWIELIRKDARIEEEEEGMFLASPIVRRQSYSAVDTLGNGPKPILEEPEDLARVLSSSPELTEPIERKSGPSVSRQSHNVESSGMSGNELASHSDFSDSEVQRIQGASIESLAVQSQHPSATKLDGNSVLRPGMGSRNVSQVSGINIENDPDRVVWQGWLWFLKSKRGVKQWKNCWAVLRMRNLILYKDESEYTAAFILALPAIVNVVDIDPLSKTKTHCMQVITDEKSYRFCAHDEESLVQCLGAFKSLLSKRNQMEARAAAVTSTTAAGATAANGSNGTTK